MVNVKNKPTITFFCELQINELKELFANNQTISQLQKINANVSMGLQDFSSERAAIVKKLTRAGIPVSAWLLLPKDQGYWTSLDTVSETVRCYQNFKEWTQKNKLQWAAVGLDIEPRIDRIQILSSNWYRYLPQLISRLLSPINYSNREAELRSLVNMIRLDGYAVETYNIPFVIEERKADSRILTKIFGTPPLDADREVLMLYSSSFGKYGDAILWSYAHQADAIGLGSTGGGVELADGRPMQSMRWMDLRRDLLIAKKFTQHIYIFSLEGAVVNGYLDRLADFDWNEAVVIPEKTGNQITCLRKIIQGTLQYLSHPVEIFISIFLFSLFFKKKK